MSLWGWVITWELAWKGRRVGYRKRSAKEGGSPCWVLGTLTGGEDACGGGFDGRGGFVEASGGNLGLTGFGLGLGLGWWSGATWVFGWEKGGFRVL